VPTTGGPTQVLYAGSPGRPFLDVAWRSDEMQIAVVEAAEAPLPDRILVVNLQTQPPTQRTILESPVDASFFVLDWARNNVDRIVFDVTPDNSTVGTIYTVDFSDTAVSPPVLVTSGRQPNFSPDNASIVYVRPASRGRNLIAKFNLATGATADLAVGINPDWKR
jgi:protease II